MIGWRCDTASKINFLTNRETAARRRFLHGARSRFPVADLVAAKPSKANFFCFREANRGSAAYAAQKF
jgi:hypothetical protein